MLVWGFEPLVLEGQWETPTKPPIQTTHLVVPNPSLEPEPSPHGFPQEMNRGTTRMFPTVDHMEPTGRALEHADIRAQGTAYFGIRRGFPPTSFLKFSTLSRLGTMGGPALACMASRPSPARHGNGVFPGALPRTLYCHPTHECLQIGHEEGKLEGAPMPGGERAKAHGAGPVTGLLLIGSMEPISF